MKVRVLEFLAFFVYESIFAYLFIVLDFYAIFIWFIKNKNTPLKHFTNFMRVT